VIFNLFDVSSYGQPVLRTFINHLNQQENAWNNTQLHVWVNAFP